MSNVPPGFRFSFQVAKESEKDLDLQITAIENRISRLCDGIRIQHHDHGEIPLLSMILGITHDKDDLERLGKALIRIAPEMERLDHLRRQKAIFEMIEKDPGWVVANLGDFGPELESFTGEIEGTSD